jgi:hypothetical protein
LSPADDSLFLDHPVTHTFEKRPRRDAGLREQSGHVQSSGFRLDGDMEAAAHALSLVAMMDIEMVDVSVRFELAIPDNQSILLGHDRPSTGTKLRPIAEVDVSGCPGFDLLFRVVAEIDDVNSVVEQSGNLLRIPKLEPAQNHSAVLKSLVRDGD